MSDYEGVERRHKSGRRSTDKVRKWRWKLLTIWIIIFTIVSMLGIHNNRVRAEEGQQAHDAICTLKKDYARQNREAREFLKLNPKGIQGIPASVIRNSIRGRENTILALRNVKCKKGDSDGG